MTAPFLPGAAWLPISYRGEAGAFAAPPIGWVLHVQAGNGSPGNWMNGLRAPNRKFSTAWVAKDGASQQFAEISCRPWAQVSGDARYLAFETEGYPNEPLTTSQIHTLAIWHNFLGMVDALAEADGQHGIGTHYMGGQAWGGHTCPDAVPGAGPRSRQRQSVINMARMLRTKVPSTLPPTSRDIPQTRLVQNAVHVTPDGSWGDITLAAGNAVIRRSLGDIAYLQARVGVKQDGVWGPVSEAARVAAVGQIQQAIRVKVDGAWGPVSQAAWNVAIKNNM